MGVYNPDRVALKIVKRSANGVNIGIQDDVELSLTEIAAMCPTYAWDTVTINGFATCYAHLVYRVLCVHGITIHCASKPPQRMKALHILINNQAGE